VGRRSRNNRLVVRPHYSLRDADAEDGPFLELMLLAAANWLPDRHMTLDQLRAAPDLAHYADASKGRFVSYVVVLSAAQVLNESVTCRGDPNRPQSLESRHRSQRGFEPSVINSSLAGTSRGMLREPSTHRLPPSAAWKASSASPGVS
jgi:hypothetical protein